MAGGRAVQTRSRKKLVHRVGQDGAKEPKAKSLPQVLAKSPSVRALDSIAFSAEDYWPPGQLAPNQGQSAMSNPVRARGHEWQFIDGMFCLTIHGDDKQTAVAIPIGALLTLAADGRRRQAALHRSTVAAKQTEPGEAGVVRYETALQVQSWSVAPTDNGMLVLILDRGLDTEMFLTLTPEVAETLAGLFTKHASAAPKT
jgi:hypothetical protein